jgi:hypothetical protein
MQLNGRKIKWGSIELDGIPYRGTLANAFISYAEFEDGTMLNEDDLEALHEDPQTYEAIYEIQWDRR